MRLEEQFLLDGNPTFNHLGTHDPGSQQRVDRQDQCVDRQDQGYAWIILSAATLSAIIKGLIYMSSAVFVVLIHDHYRLTWTQTTAIMSLQFTTSTLFAIPYSYFVKRVGCRTSSILTHILLAISLMVAALVDNLVVFILFFSVFTGIGVLAFQVPYGVAVQRYFNRWLSFSMSTIFTGLGVGLLIASPLIVALDENYGLFGALLITAAISSNGCVTGALLRPFKACKDVNDARKCESKTKKSSFLNLPRRLYIFAFLSFLLQIGHCAILLFTYARGIKLGFEPKWAAMLSSILGITALTRFIFGGIIDILKLDRGLLVGTLSSLAGVTIILSTFNDSFAYIAMAMVLYGLLSDAYIPQCAALLALLVDEEDFEAATGIGVIIFEGSTLFSNLISGPLMDYTSGDATAFILYGFLVSCGGIGVCIQALHLRRQGHKM